MSFKICIHVRSYTALLDDFQSHKDFYVRPPHKVCGKTFVYFHYLIQAKVYKSFSAHFIYYNIFQHFFVRMLTEVEKISIRIVSWMLSLATFDSIVTWNTWRILLFTIDFFSKVCQNKFVTISSVYLSLKMLTNLFLHTGRVHIINHVRRIPALCGPITPGMSTHFFPLTLKLVFE